MNQDLSDILARLKANSSSEVWDEFVRRFGAYTHDVTVAVTLGEPGNILVLQGRAQQCLALERMIKECAVKKS